MWYSVLQIFALLSAVHAWLPHERNLFSDHLSADKGRSFERSLPPVSRKIRGVNLGSLFIVEPWMANDEWSQMGCAGTKSEFDCVLKLGQNQANLAFQRHWNTFINEQDLDTMKSYGINTIRVPVGYWMIEETVYKDSEHFPQGGLGYLDRLAGWAASRNIYVILDLHGAPGAQEQEQPFTGQFAPTAGFFVSWQYDRAYRFLQIMTERIHTNSAYRTTGMLGVVNEPGRGHNDLVSQYYPTAYDKIREVESRLQVPRSNQLTIQYMDQDWGAGNARNSLGSRSGVAYDDHRYLKWAPIEHSKDSYIRTSCSDSFGAGGNTPLIVGEWSLSVESSVEWNTEWDPTKQENKAFYTRWWAAQVHAYEKQLGWVFWSWKTQLGGDWRWSYKAAVEAGVIPRDPNQANGLARC